MRSSRSSARAYSRSPWMPSLPSSKAAQPRSSSPRATTTAAAASPKRIAVERSSMSVIRESASAPHTSTTSARSDSTSAAACSSAARKPAQAALTSYAPAPCAPIRAATSGARPGVRRSGVIVETITRSTAAASRWASSRADAQASAARSASERVPLSQRRSWMPVRRTIHSSLVSRRSTNAALATTSSGSAAPTPKIPELTAPPLRERKTEELRPPCLGHFTLPRTPGFPGSTRRRRVSNGRHRRAVRPALQCGQSQPAGGLRALGKQLPRAEVVAASAAAAQRHSPVEGRAGGQGRRPDSLVHLQRVREMGVGLLPAPEFPREHPDRARDRTERTQGVEDDLLAPWPQPLEQCGCRRAVAQVGGELGPEHEGAELHGVGRDGREPVGRRPLEQRTGPLFPAGLQLRQRVHGAEDRHARRRVDDLCQQIPELVQPALLPPNRSDLRGVETESIGLAGLHPECRGGVGKALGFLQPPAELRAPRLLRAQHEPQPRLTEAIGQRAQG